MGMVLRRRDARAGFSLIETLIAAALLLVIALGLLPLFTQAIVNNSLGNDYTQASTHSKVELETLQKMPFESLDLALDDGQLQATRASWLEQGIAGHPAAPLRWLVDEPDTPLWTRTTEVRQYNVRALSEDDWRFEEDERKAGGNPVLAPGELVDENVNSIQIKSIEVRLDSAKRDTPMGGINRMTFVLLKPF
jgi:prepilin-type N-terminal cleavage/methylation domain-containing protein